MTLLCPFQYILPNCFEPYTAQNENPYRSISNTANVTLQCWKRARVISLKASFVNQKVFRLLAVVRWCCSLSFSPPTDNYMDFT